MPLFSHYGDIPDISDQLSVPSLVFAIVTPIIVLARLLSRRFIAGQLGADDWTILASLAFSEVVTIQMILICELGFGKHFKDLSHEVRFKTLRLFWVAQILYKVNIGLTKISILLLYIRLFIQRWFLVTSWTFVGIVVAFTVGTVMSSVFQCTPVEFAFNKALPGGGHCLSLPAFWYANAAFNILSDLVLIGLPIPIIFKLQLPLRSKVALCGVFAIGIFVCITSILRITTLNLATSHLDVTWNAIPSSMWTIIESNLGIICACLPALRLPLSLIFPRLFSRLQKTAYAPSKTDPRKPPTRSTAVGSKQHTSNKGSGWSVLDEASSTEANWHMGTTAQHNSSQDHIVEDDDQYERKAEIRKTTRVVVEYKDTDEEALERADPAIELTQMNKFRS